MTAIRCRAHISKHCEDGRICEPDEMEGDGTFDGETIVCTACYLAGGQPGLHVTPDHLPSHAEVVSHVDQELGL